jgi:fumarylpyruvate hydrolase
MGRWLRPDPTRPSGPAKEKGRPWDASKGFDQSAPCGPITLGALPDPIAAIALSVNGEARQSGRLDDMVWNPHEIVAKAALSVDVKPAT